MARQGCCRGHGTWCHLKCYEGIQGMEEREESITDEEFEES